MSSGSKKIKNRQSPTESATLYKIGTKKTGNDGNIWIIAENIKGIKRWKLYKKKTAPNPKPESLPEPPRTKKISVTSWFDIVNINDGDLKKVMNKNESTKNIYNLITKELMPELKKMDFATDIIPLPLSEGGIYWSDYPSAFMDDHHDKGWVDKFMYFVVYMNSKGNLIETSKNITVGFSSLTLDDKKKIVSLFQRVMPEYFDWDGNNMHSILISYSPHKKNKIDVAKLKENDTYPQLYLWIKTPSKKRKKTAETASIDDNLDLAKKLTEQLKDLDLNLVFDYEYSFFDVIFNIYAVGKKDQNTIKSLIKRFMKDYPHDYKIEVFEDE